MRVVKKIDKQYRTAKLKQDIEEDVQKQKAALKRGILPNYLVQFKQQAEEEKQRTLQAIALNKRPQGTMRLR